MRNPSSTPILNPLFPILAASKFPEMIYSYGTYSYDWLQAFLDLTWSDFNRVRRPVPNLLPEEGD